MLKVKVISAESRNEFEEDMNTALASLKGKRILSFFYTTDAVVQIDNTSHPAGGETVDYDSTIKRYFNGFISYEE